MYPFLFSSFVFVDAFLLKREVPQEHSHDLILNEARTFVQKSADPLAKVDVVFGLLGDTAATNGLKEKGQPTEAKDLACLHQRHADLCLTEAKSNKDKLICIQFAALERNTGAVGRLSAACTETPKNSEIANVKQHQDAASDGAKENNNKVEIEVARQAVALGFSIDDAVNFAFQTSTFAPGRIGDPTAKGNACDEGPGKPNGNRDPVIADQDGVVFGRKITKGQTIDCSTLATLHGTNQKLVPAATKEEIAAALNGVADGAAPKTPPAGDVGAGAMGGAASAATGNLPLSCSGGQSGGNGSAFGKCTAPNIDFIAGRPGRKADEFTFKPSGGANGEFGGQPEALDFDIIANFICLRFNDQCRLAPGQPAPAFNNFQKALDAAHNAGGQPEGKCGKDAQCGQAKIDAYLKALQG